MFRGIKYLWNPNSRGITTQKPEQIAKRSLVQYFYIIYE